MSKVTIVYRRKDDKKDKEVEFSGDVMRVLSQGMNFIFNNQPINVIAIRKELC